MYAFLTAVYVAFAVVMTYLCGSTAYELTKNVKWMKNQDILGLFFGFCAFAVLIKYGWPIYQVIVIKEFT